MSRDYFLKIIKQADKEYDQEAYGKNPEFIDTGSLALNALISAKIKNGGMAENRIIGLAGEESTGKTFLALGIIKNYLDKFENSVVIFFDTEHTLTKDFLNKRKIDPDRIIVIEPESVEDFRTKSVRIVDAYIKDGMKHPMMMILDSLGNVASAKEINDALEGEDKVDMTRAKVIKSTFRILTTKLGKANVPMIVTSHTYEPIGNPYANKGISGGSGLKFVASTIITLSKAKDKDGTDVIGNIITAKTQKSRFSKEQQAVKLKLSYSTGLDKYYGLLDLAERGEVIKKEGRQFILPTGEKVFGKVINDDPKRIFDDPVIMEKMEEAAKNIFGLGEGMDVSLDSLDEEDLDDMLDEVETD